MIEVIDGKIAERESFITRIGTLSIPGDLFVDIALMIGQGNRAVLTVESNYAIAIATLSDWLKRLVPVFQPKPIAPRTRDFSRASSQLQVIARNCDWFIAPPARVVIGRSNCFGFGFSTVI